MTKRLPKLKPLAPPPPAADEEPTAQPRAKRPPLIDRLAEWRKKHDLTQRETAARLEISYETYKAYEWGTRVPNGPRTQRILALLGDLKK